MHTEPSPRVEALESPERLTPEPLDPQLRTIQPGGGICMSLELKWGYVRRWLLKRLFPGYVKRMAELRQGERNPCPHEVLDPRDVKFYQNQPGAYWWARQDDPYAWREHLPFVRVGLAEVFLFSLVFVALAGLAACWKIWAALPLVVLWLLVLWFFRNPRRVPATDPGLVISPADGRVVSVTDIEHDDYIGGPAVEIGIFLSVFNVHINRVPEATRVIGMTYRKGKFLNALLPASARENEQLAVRLEASDAPHRRFIVRQIAGAIARRIVCRVAPGEELARGAAFGMIKFGSRTELVMPREPGLEITTRPGQHVSAGTSVLAKYTNTTAGE